MLAFETCKTALVLKKGTALDRSKQTCVERLLLSVLLISYEIMLSKSRLMTDF